MDSAGSISKYDNADNLLCHQQVLGLQPHRAHPKTQQSKENIQLSINKSNLISLLISVAARSVPALRACQSHQWHPGVQAVPGIQVGQQVQPLLSRQRVPGQEREEGLLDVDGTCGRGWKSGRESVSCTHRGSRGSLSSDLAVLSGGTLGR